MNLVFDIDYSADPGGAVTVMHKKRVAQELYLEEVAGCGMTFNAIDVETANSARSTICQIGVAHVVDGQIVDRWVTLVNPEDHFDDFNIGVHGIRPEQVQDAPTLPEVRAELKQRLRGRVLVSHSPYDRNAFQRAMDKYNLEQLQVYWLDCVKVARRAWPDKLRGKGYGLKNVANYIGYTFKHHDALEDAVAAAEIMLAACRERDVDIEYWLSAAERRIPLNKKRDRKQVKLGKREGNPDGEHYGEILVFTGELGMVRDVASDYAAYMGFNVAPNVTKKTTVLVNGQQKSYAVKSASGKSNSHIKAEKLISKGHEIRIINETDFLSLAANHQPPVPVQTLSAEKERKDKTDEDLLLQDKF